MASKKKQVILRATKEELFDVLKAALPSAFGTKVWTDVEYFGVNKNHPPLLQDEFILIFKEEPDP